MVKVGEPVDVDSEYYRDDDGLVDQVLASAAPVVYVFGPRRSGKTSFLKKLRRRSDGTAVMVDFLQSAATLQGLLDEIRQEPGITLVLLDEVLPNIFLEGQGGDEPQRARKEALLAEFLALPRTTGGRARCVVGEVPLLKDKLDSHPDPDRFAFVGAQVVNLPGFGWSEKRALLELSQSDHPVPLDAVTLGTWAEARVSGLPIEVALLAQYLDDHRRNPKRTDPSPEDFARHAKGGGFWHTVFRDLSAEQKLLIGLMIYNPNEWTSGDLAGGGDAEVTELILYGLAEEDMAQDRFRLTSAAFEAWLRGRDEVPVPEQQGRISLLAVLTDEAAERIVGRVEPPQDIRIHHLSDLSLGRYLDAASGSRGWGGSRLDSYRRFVEDMAPETRPHLIIVSGDLTSTGSEKEVELAKRFLKRILILLPALPGAHERVPEQVIVVPGDADQSWEAGPDDRFGTFACVLGADANFVQPFVFERGRPPRPARNYGGISVYAFNSANPPTELSGDGRDAIATHEARSIYEKLVGWRQQLAEEPKTEFADEANPERYLTPSEELARFVGNDLSKVRSEDIRVATIRSNLAEVERSQDRSGPAPVRIAVCHHNLHQLANDPMVDLMNAYQLRLALAATGFHFVLHGHKHLATQIRETFVLGDRQHTLRTIGAPALGAISVPPAEVVGDDRDLRHLMPESASKGFNALTVSRAIENDRSVAKVQLKVWVWDDESLSFRALHQQETFTVDPGREVR